MLYRYNVIDLTFLSWSTSPISNYTGRKHTPKKPRFLALTFPELLSHSKSSAHHFNSYHATTFSKKAF